MINVNTNAFNALQQHFHLWLKNGRSRSDTKREAVVLEKAFMCVYSDILPRSWIKRHLEIGTGEVELRKILGPRHVSKKLIHMR